jgi:uncharacterized protein
VAQPMTGQLRVVDTDVHHNTRSPKDLFPYLSKMNQERVAEWGFPLLGSAWQANGGYRGRRVDSFDDDMVDAGSKLAKVQSQLLDECGIDLALLTSAPPVYDANTLTDVDYAAALMSAFNDFTIEHWLDQDQRLRYAMFVPTADPELAVKEIQRIGDHPSIVAIMLSGGSLRPLGHRSFDRIYEACADHGLSVALHFGTEGKGINGPPTAAGYPTYYIESRLARPSFYQVHLSSFIFEGTFEKFPSLKVAMLEGGWAWVPSYRWRMDADWKSLRSQTPWVKRLPSEYVSDHIRFSSQPIEEPDTTEQMLQIIDWMDGARTLMFSTDYPHWDFDHPHRAFPKLPEALHRRIFVENALDAFPKMRATA